jgi:hypothetical protein
MSDQFEVLENAGMYNENEVGTFSTYNEAQNYVNSNYTKEEQKKMRVDITCNGSTEY